MAKKIIDNSIVGKRSIQNLSCNWTGSADFGRIVPFQWNELLGTDKVQTCHPKIELVALPFASPTFGKMDIYVHYFFVPTRLLVEGYRDFQNDDGPYKNISMPFWTPADFLQAYSLIPTAAKRAVFKHWTSMGLPPFFTNVASMNNSPWLNLKPISLLPFRAYNQIWWDYFRDPEVFRDDNKEQIIDLSAGRRPTALVDNKYFPRYRNIKDTWVAELFADNGSRIADEVYFASAEGPDVVNREDTSSSLRKIEALTRFAERMSMSGKRSIDLLFARYGIKPEWDKLNMCQYVGGGKGSVLVKDITSTADTQFQGGSPLGLQSGKGYAALSQINIEFEAKEPGYLMGVFSIMPKVRYVQGITKEWFRRYREDFFTKHLEHTGQVAVAKGEVAHSYTANQQATSYRNEEDDEVFAFTEPYYEYKRGVDILAGDFMYYHNSQIQMEPGSDIDPSDRDLQYMQSMEMFIDYPSSRDYDAENLQIDPLQFNKVFNYLGGSGWSDTDDHFHLCIEKDIVLNRPMDGYAVPTIETTEDPHQTKTQIKQSVEL